MDRYHINIKMLCYSKFTCGHCRGFSGRDSARDWTKEKQKLIRVVMNRIIVRVWVVVYNPTEVKQLIIVSVDNLEELDIKEHASYLSGSQINQEMMMNDDVAGNETAGEL